MKLTTLLTVFLVHTAALVTFAQGFCIYNYTDDVTYWLKQLEQNAPYFSAPRFKRSELKPGENACCPWTTHDCNTTGDKNAELYVGFRGNSESHKNFKVNLPAGGWIELHGQGQNSPEVRVYNADGSPYPFKIDYKDMCFIGC